MADRTSEIPKEFPLKEQYQVLRRTIEIRREFISGKRGRNQMGDEQYNIEMYNVAALDAALETIGKAYAADRDARSGAPRATETQTSASKRADDASPEDKAAEARRRAMAESGDDGF